jgi:protein TonB
MLQMSRENKERAASATAVAVFHALLLYALLTSLGFNLDRARDEELKLIQVAKPPPPPLAKPARPHVEKKARRPRPKDPEGAAAPAGLRNTPTDIVAPPTPIPVPPPLPAAKVAGQGSVAAAGATNLPGPGTGAGGQGNGLGSGTQGSGTGGGGGGGRGSRARWISGAIRDSDYPRAAFEARKSGTVHLRFVVAPTGRVTSCTVTRSSGSSALDSTTCRLIVQRFRYRPARDGAGRPVAETVGGEHDWELGPEPPPVEVEPEEEPD